LILAIPTITIRKKCSPYSNVSRTPQLNGHILQREYAPVWRTPTVEEYTENWHCLCIFTYICNSI